jgi:hypothetical protein
MCRILGGLAQAQAGRARRRGQVCRVEGSRRMSCAGALQNENERVESGEARVAKLAPGWGRRGRARREVRLLKGAIDVAKGMVKRVRRKRNVALRERVGVRRHMRAVSSSSSSSDGRPGGVMIGISKTVDRHGLIIHLACRESNALAAGESNSDRQSGVLAPG